MVCEVLRENSCFHTVRIQLNIPLAPFSLLCTKWLDNILALSAK